jgi:hypothetical protein
MFARRQVRRVVVAAAVTASLLFAAGAVGAGAATGPRASDPSWPTRLVTPANMAVGPIVIPGEPYVYGIVLAHASGTAGYLDRFNLATGAVTRGAAVYVSATAQLVTVGNQLGFANGPACTTGCMPSLDTIRTFSFVDLHSLVPTRPPDIVPANAVFATTNSVPASYCVPQSCATPGGIKSEPGQVWIGTGANVELINLSPIETPALHNPPLRGPIHVPGGQVVALAVSPNCRYLYVGV